MISNQILQSTIDGLKSITRTDICILDTEANVLASTINNTEEYQSAILSFVDSPAESQAMQGYQFFKVFDENQLEYVVLAKGDSEDVFMIGKIAASRFKVYWLHIRKGMTRIISLRTYCLIICF